MESEQALVALTARITRLESEMRSRLATMERRVAALEPGTTVTPATVEPATRTATAPPVATTPPPPRPDDAIATAPARADAGARSPTGPAPGRFTRPTFEVGVEALLRWAGIVLVVLAAVFLVSTAISRGWIGPELQLLGATLIGFGLLATALWMVADRRNWALALGNGGAAVIIVCAGAAYSWLELYDAMAGLGAVAMAAAVAVLVAMRLRMESVAITATAAMLVVPTWARIVADAPVAATGIWLGLFAVVATVVGLDQRWILYKVVSTWSAALWVLGLAGFLYFEDNTDHMVQGFALVAVIGVVLWSGPTLSRSLIAARPRTAPPSGDRPRERRATTLTALEHRSTLLVPLWVWSSVLLFGGYDIERPGGPIGSSLAAGFIALALGAGSAGLITRIAVGSHLLGAGLLITVAVAAWLGGPILVVVVAGQALTTLVVSRWFSDRLMTFYAYALGALAWVLLLEELGDTIDHRVADLGDGVAHGAAVAALAALAWLTNRSWPAKRTVTEVCYGLAWTSGMLYITSLLAPYLDDRGWNPLGVGLTLAGLVAARWLGRYVLVIAVAVGVVTVGSGAVGIVLVAVDGGDPAYHLSNLSVVAGLIAVTVWMWWMEQRPELSRPLFVISWIWSLGWLASVLLDGPQGQVATSIAWAIAACGAIVVGVRSNDLVVRIVGLATLGLVLAKLLTVDLAAVDTLWRVGLFLVIGLGLLRLGYVLPALAERFGQPAGQGTQTGNGDDEALQGAGRA